MTIKEKILEEIEDINYAYNNCSKYETIKNLLDEMANERKKGKWIKMSDSDGIYYCCSECGEELYREWTFDREYDIFPKKRSIDKTNFCPNCGADMRGERKITND